MVSWEDRYVQVGDARLEEARVSPEREHAVRADLLRYAERDLAELESAKDDLDVFYALPRATFAAFRLGNLEQAEALAHRALAVAPSHSNDWNYGNAIHAAHTVLHPPCLSPE